MTTELNGCFDYMPEDSLLNKNVAVYNANGSMRTRAYCLNRILQAANGPEEKWESLVICDPKSELYERTSSYLEKTHVVKVFNLVSPLNADFW